MRRGIPYIVTGLAAVLLFMHSLGGAHLFDWDEINFAESAREMIATGDYLRVQINYEPFWEKPPLFFWMQVLSMRAFGVNEFAARFPNAVCGIVTLLVLYRLGRRLHGEGFARWWVLVYAGSFLPHLYFKSGIIDPWFNLFIFLGIHRLSAFLSAREAGRAAMPQLMLSALFTGLGILTKGPVALLVVVLTYAAFLPMAKGRGRVPLRYPLAWGAGVAGVTLLWFGLEILQHGWWFVEEFVTYQIRLATTQDAGHGGFLLYHFVVLLVGCYPASLLFTRSSAPGGAHVGRPSDFRLLMQASLIVVLAVFTLVRTKIVHYSSFAYFPIGYLAATTVHGLVEGSVRIRGWQRAGLLALGILWALLFIALPILGENIEWLRPLMRKDPFALGNTHADVRWGYHLVLPGLLFLAAVIFMHRMLSKGDYRRGFLLLLIACIGVMQVSLTAFAPRIEGYSQRAAIDHFESLRGKDAYVVSYGYKSYAPYFYAAVPPGRRVESRDVEWLLTGAVDKPVHVVIKAGMEEAFISRYGKNVRLVGRRNGFVFFERGPVAQ